jgi:hypothetical protein
VNLNWDAELLELREQVAQIRQTVQAEAAPIVVPVVPTVIEFILSSDYLGKTLFPRQATQHKVTWLEVDALTLHDLETIDEWSAGFVVGAHDDLYDGQWFEPAHGFDHTRGSTPDLVDRMILLRSRGRRSFRVRINAEGRRAGKGESAGNDVAYLLWQLLAQGEPQLSVNAARGKTLTVDVYGGNQQEARSNVHTDIVRTIVQAKCFWPYIDRLTRDRLVLATPADLAAGRPGTIEIVARETTTLAARGQASVCAVFDEMASIEVANSKLSAEDLFNAALPALDQARGWALVICLSSPAQRAGKFYGLFRQGCEIDEATGTAAYPEIFVRQGTSWDPYLDAEIAITLPVVSDETAATSDWYRNADGTVRCFSDPGGAPVIYDDELRQRERADPVTFAVENAGQWADVEDALLHPKWIRRTFEAPDGITLAPNQPRFGTHQYRLHIDPSSKRDPTAYMIAHAETVADGTTYMVIDRIRRIVPIDGDIPIDEVYIQLEADLRELQPDSFTVDQHGGQFLLHDIKGRVPDLLRSHRISFELVPHTRSGNVDLAATFKAAMRNGLIRSFPDRQLELELRFLQEVNGCAKAPTTGPCTTDDVAMCALVLAKQILGDAGGYGAELGGLPLGGHPGIGNHPLGEQFSAAGGGRRASYPQRPSRISRWHRTRRAS